MLKILAVALLIAKFIGIVSLSWVVTILLSVLLWSFWSIVALIVGLLYILMG